MRLMECRPGTKMPLQIVEGYFASFCLLSLNLILRLGIQTEKEENVTEHAVIRTCLTYVRLNRAIIQI